MLVLGRVDAHIGRVQQLPRDGLAIRIFVRERRRFESFNQLDERLGVIWRERGVVGEKEVRDLFVDSVRGLQY